MRTEELKDFLEYKFEEFNRPEFIENDPVQIPHRFSKKEDIEIAGFLTSLIAWGRRDLIIRAAKNMMELMENEPHDFILYASENELQRLNEFVYRTFNAIDLRSIISGLSALYTSDSSLEKLMTPQIGEKDTFGAICRTNEYFTTHHSFAKRSQKHLANPAKGSSAKRLNMYLRWMIRDDGRGVDFGIWKDASPSQLICPLDVHTGNVSRALGLLERKQNDWRSATALTDKLREFDPEDPVKYDFSLFGLGVFENFGK